MFISNLKKMFKLTSLITIALFATICLQFSNANLIKNALQQRTSNIFFKPRGATMDKEYYFGIEQKMNWYGANYFCEALGMQLIGIETAEEARLLKNYIYYSGFQTNTYWTSGNNVIDEKSWMWGMNGNEMTYTNWAQSYPKGIDNCVRLSPSVLDWYNEPCDNKYFFICESIQENLVTPKPPGEGHE